MRTTVVVERAQLVARTRADGRHVYRKEGKSALVAACSGPGASVAAIALAHGVNANLLRKWITRSHMRDRPSRDQRTETPAVGDS
jgi:transposase-like protein